MNTDLIDEEELRSEIVRTGQRMYERHLIVATEGNISGRLDAEHILATPSGLCKGDLSPDDLVIIDMRGNHISGKLKVSSEIAMHLEVYRRRADAVAVVHAHPPNCIALMLAGYGLDRPILAENVLFLGLVPTAPYARPSTPQVPESIRPYVEKTDCMLLDHHGSLTIGRSVIAAFHKLEMMEHSALSYLAALQTGPVREIDPEEARTLRELREKGYRIIGPTLPYEE